MQKKEDGNHIVAVIGGATSGAEVAMQLTNMDVEVAVFDRHLLPYGKIDDGLPRWHSKLQQKEFKNIDSKLSHQKVKYIPGVKLGKDYQLDEIVQWGFSLLVLATGASVDRPLNIPGVEEVTDLSFAYQNDFIYWFNHYEDANYQGTRFPLKDGAVVIGGGLASLDVTKICQLENTVRKLKILGIETDVIHLEHKGIPSFLAEHNMSWHDLNLEPAKLYYRRRLRDMPLAAMPPDADDVTREKIEKVREKIIENAQRKFLFELHPLHAPKAMIVEAGHVKGIIFEHTEIVQGKVVMTGQEVVVNTEMVISSIGSIPEPLPGMTMEGELYKLKDKESSHLEGYDNVFVVGNAVTGQGNIRASMRHGRAIGKMLSENLTQTGPDYEKLVNLANIRVEEYMQELKEYLTTLPHPDKASCQLINEKIRMLQQLNGFDGNYEGWVASRLAERKA